MDAAQALADLTEISSQIQVAVLFDEEGAVIGSTLADDARARRLVEAALELVDAAKQASPGEAPLAQVEVATGDGSVFVVGDGSRRIVATTGPEPTVGLVFYDLKSCLRDAAAGPVKPKRAPRKRKQTEEGSGDAA